jgi:hypothetical protein
MDAWSLRSNRIRQLPPHDVVERLPHSSHGRVAVVGVLTGLQRPVPSHVDTGAVHGDDHARLDLAHAVPDRERVLPFSRSATAVPHSR